MRGDGPYGNYTCRNKHELESRVREILPLAEGTRHGN